MAITCLEVTKCLSKFFPRKPAAPVNNITFFFKVFVLHLKQNLILL